MIKRLASLENEFSVSKAAIIVGFFTLLSRLAGLVREALFASLLGPGDRLDVYYASFRLPDLVFNLLVLGTLSVSFIPVYTELWLSDKKRANSVASTVLNLSILIMSAVCLVLFFLAPELARLIVPGFLGQKFADTVLLTRIFLVSPVIFTASSVFSSVLHSRRRFLVVSLAPILYNAGIIFGLLVLYPRFGLAGWGAGVLAGALLHLLIQVPSARALGFSWQAVLNLKDAAVRKIGRLFVPRIFGLDISNISLLIATVIGSTLAAGTISIFNLANNLQTVPLGIFALSVSVAAFPALSEKFAQRQWQSYIKILQKSMVQILFYVLPISILILLYRAYIVRLVYGRGMYDWTDTILTFSALGMFTISLFAQSLAPLFSRAFYAQHDTKTPVAINAASMILNAVLSYFLAKQDGTYGGATGLALAFSLASIFNALVLFLVLRSRLEKMPGEAGLLEKFDGGLLDAVSKICGASVAMGAVGYVTLRVFAPLVNTKTAAGIFVQAGLSCLCAVLVFVVTSKKMGLEETGDLLGFVGRFLGKRKG